MSKITCPNCGHAFEMNDAILEQAKAEMEKKYKKDMKQVEERIRKEESEKAENAKSEAVGKALEQQSTLIEDLRAQIKSQKESNEQLRKDLSTYMEKFSKLQEDSENKDIEYKKKLEAEKEEIRKTVEKNVSEEKELEISQLKMKLEGAEKAAEEAAKKAKQGSQQTQGEVLEIGLEECLRNNFRDDDIQEVKKGERGADVKQFVKFHGKDCGLILWETKNAKWNPQWIKKLKDDMLESKATVGVLVTVNMPDEYGEFAEIEGIWVIRPSFAIQVSALLRKGLIDVFTANVMAENKDAVVEYAYKYITGPEFKNRLMSIIDNYTALKSILESEKRSTMARWKKQEKAIDMVVSSTSEMYGSLKGIMGSSLEDIKELEPPEEE